MLPSCSSAALSKAAGYVFFISASPGIVLLMTAKCQDTGSFLSGVQWGWKLAEHHVLQCCCLCFPLLALPRRLPGKRVLCPEWGLPPLLPL